MALSTYNWWHNDYFSRYFLFGCCCLDMQLKSTILVWNGHLFIYNIFCVAGFGAPYTLTTAESAEHWFRMWCCPLLRVRFMGKATSHQINDAFAFEGAAWWNSSLLAMYSSFSQANGLEMIKLLELIRNLWRDFLKGWKERSNIQQSLNYEEKFSIHLSFPNYVVVTLFPWKPKGREVLQSA